MDSKQDFQQPPSNLDRKSRSLSQAAETQAEENDEEVLKLAWIVSVLKRRLLFMSAVAVALTGVAGGMIVWTDKKAIPIYTGSVQILVEPVTAESILNRLYSQAGTPSQKGVGDVANVGRITDSSMDYPSQILVLQSPKLMVPIVEELKKVYPDISYPSLMQGLRIERISVEIEGSPIAHGTKVLNISYVDANQKKIIAVLKKVAATYINYSFNERKTSIDQAISFIRSRLPQLQQRVDSLQKQIQTLRQEYHLINPEESNRSIEGQLTLIASERLNTQARLAEQRERYTALQRHFLNGNLTALLSRESKTFDGLLRRAQQIEADMALASAKFREDSKPMQVLHEKNREIRQVLYGKAQEIIDQAADDIAVLEAREQEVLETERILKQRLERMPLVTRQYVDAQRELEVATEILNEFSTKEESLSIDAAQTDIPWELIAKPQLHKTVSGKPIAISPIKTKRLLMLAGILSSLVGIGAGFFMELLDIVFHAPNEVKAATKLPLLAVIPYIKKLRKQPRTPKLLAQSPLKQLPSWKNGTRDPNNDENANDSLFLEAFRSLHTNIRFLNADRPISVIAVSSATPGDGKSTVALHLAQTAAAMGQRVLLVDADLRRPKIHQLFNLPNEKGMSELLAADLNFSGVIQHLSSQDNLFVLTAGQLASDPVKLLSSKMMADLVEQSRAVFDLTIYDTPPLLGLADSNLVSAQTDGMVLVVGLEKTKRPLVMQAVDELKLSGTSILGTVANGIQGYTPETYASYRR